MKLAGTRSFSFHTLVSLFPTLSLERQETRRRRREVGGRSHGTGHRREKCIIGGYPALLSSTLQYTAYKVLFLFPGVESRSPNITKWSRLPIFVWMFPLARAFVNGPAEWTARDTARTAMAVKIQTRNASLQYQGAAHQRGKIEWDWAGRARHAYSACMRTGPLPTAHCPLV